MTDLVLQPTPPCPVHPDLTVQARNAALHREADEMEVEEDKIRSRIVDLEEEADDFAVGAADCRRRADALDVTRPSAFDVPRPLVLVTRGKERSTVDCSVCGPVAFYEDPMARVRPDAPWAARQHALVAHDGDVDAEGWAR